METTNTNCPHNHPGCPGPTGYDVDDLDSGICGDCEVEAMCSESPAVPVTNKHGELVCDHAGCKSPRP